MNKLRWIAIQATKSCLNISLSVIIVIVFFQGFPFSKVIKAIPIILIVGYLAGLPLSYISYYLFKEKKEKEKKKTSKAE